MARQLTMGHELFPNILTLDIHQKLLIANTGRSFPPGQCMGVSYQTLGNHRDSGGNGTLALSEFGPGGHVLHAIICTRSLSLHEYMRF